MFDVTPGWATAMIILVAVGIALYLWLVKPKSKTPKEVDPLLAPDWRERADREPSPRKRIRTNELVRELEAGRRHQGTITR